MNFLFLSIVHNNMNAIPFFSKVPHDCSLSFQCAAISIIIRSFFFGTRHEAICGGIQTIARAARPFLQILKNSEGKLLSIALR